jgi:hypothetical protein
MDSKPQSQLILYQTEDGQTQIQVVMQGDTVWLTQKEMAELFQRDQIGYFPAYQQRVQRR